MHPSCGQPRKKFRLNGKQPNPFVRHVSWPSLPCSHSLVPFLYDLDVLRYAACSRGCRSFVFTPGVNGRLLVSNVMLPARGLCTKIAEKLAEKLEWSVLERVTLAPLFQSDCPCFFWGTFDDSKRHEAACKNGLLLPTNMESINIEEFENHRVEGLALIASSILKNVAMARKRMPIGPKFLPALREVDLSGLELSKNSDLAGRMLEGVLVPLFREAPQLKTLTMGSGRRIVNPESLCKSLGLVPPAWSPVSPEADSCNGKPHLPAAPNLVNFFRIDSERFALCAGYLAAHLTHQAPNKGDDDLSVFDVDTPGEEMDMVYDEAVFQAFVQGYIQSDLTLKPEHHGARELEICNVDLRGAKKEFLQLLEALPALQELHVSCCLGEDAFRSLASCSLSTLNLRCLTFQGEILSGIDLAPLLASTPSLEDLNFSHSDFGDIEAELLANGAQAMPTLRVVVFTGCQLQSVSGARSVALAITAFGNVSELYLWLNSWDLRAYSMFAVHLGDRAALCLRDLRIGYDEDPHPGAATADGMSLSVLLNKTRQLEQLHMMNMYLGSSSLAVLKDGTYSLSNLRHWSFNGCLGFRTRAGGQLLAKALAKVAPNLRFLAFENCAPKALFAGMADGLASSTASGREKVRFDQLHTIAADTFDDHIDDLEEHPAIFDWRRYWASAAVRESLLRKLRPHCPHLVNLVAHFWPSSTL